MVYQLINIGEEQLTRDQISQRNEALEGKLDLDKFVDFDDLFKSIHFHTSNQSLKLLKKLSYEFRIPENQSQLLSWKQLYEKIEEKHFYKSQLKN